MKNTVLNVLSVKLAFVSFILAGLFLLAPSHIQAQQSLNDLFSVPNGPYTTPATAITRVEAKCLQLKSQYEILTPGTQAYDENASKYSFYSAILQVLYDGKTVKEALETGVKFLGTDAAGNISKANFAAYKQEAINLLKP